MLLDLNNLSGATNHNGGAMHFGPDGKLYVAVGENAEPGELADAANLLGKMLRINADGSHPDDNPFFGTATGQNRAIWALGLRNPFTFAFQPGTGRMFINDVGAEHGEEINDGIAGANYGWPASEGPTSNPAPSRPGLLLRARQHGHHRLRDHGRRLLQPGRRRTSRDLYLGRYFFADFCTGWIRLFDPATGTASAFATGIPSPVDLQVAADGSLYYLERGTRLGVEGRVHRQRGAARSRPIPPA